MFWENNNRKNEKKEQTKTFSWNGNETAFQTIVHAIFSIFIMTSGSWYWRGFHEMMWISQPVHFESWAPEYVCLLFFRWKCCKTFDCYSIMARANRLNVNRFVGFFLVPCGALLPQTSTNSFITYWKFNRKIEKKKRNVLNMNNKSKWNKMSTEPVFGICVLTLSMYSFLYFFIIFIMQWHVSFGIHLNRSKFGIRYYFEIVYKWIILYRAIDLSSE